MALTPFDHLSYPGIFVIIASIVVHKPLPVIKLHNPFHLLFAGGFSLFAVQALLLLFLTGCSTINQGMFSVAEKAFPGCIYQMETDRKYIALTIDDAPGRGTTEEILSVLEQYDARATFFIISDYIAGNEDLVEKIVSQGNELGHHMTSDEPSIKLSQEEFENKFEEADRLLSRFDDVSWFRPGSARYNDRMLSYLKSRSDDYRCVLGSVYPFDHAIHTPKLASTYILTNVEPGAIVVLHDRGERGRTTVETLSRVLPELKAKGYEVVTLSELYSVGIPDLR